MQTPRDSAAPAGGSRLAAMQEHPLDVLVVGGGIVGAGVARDAAQRGLRTALIEQFDSASGTSSRSSRLLHGGVRYLAQARFGLVREASREKTILGHIAPHLAQPLPFIFPTRKGSTWSRWKLSLGVKLYDLLCGMRNFGRSSSLGPSETFKLLPGLRNQNLTGAVRYFDALTNDARLVLDTLRSIRRIPDIRRITAIDAEGSEIATIGSAWMLEADTVVFTRDALDRAQEVYG